MSWLHGAMARAKLLFRGRNDSRIEREFAFHVDMEAERLVREQRLTPDEARRQARVAFGPTQSHRESLRDDRPFAWISGVGLDLRLGLRMLRKFPGLTIVGVVGMGMAVSIATFFFTIVELAMNPVLPIKNGDRIVGIRTWDLRAQKPVSGSIHEYDVYRESLKSIDVLAAFKMAERNFALPDSTGEEVFIAEMTASAFRAIDIPARLGRTIQPADEVAGSPLVVVISHRLWQERFQGNTSVLGSEVRIGDREYAIVGVMPEGFAFPVSQDAWMALQLGPTTPLTGPALNIFGRLASGGTREAAQLEVTTAGQRLAAEQPALRSGLQPQIVSFPALVGMTLTSENEDLRFIILFVPLLLILVCVNVATLVYARTASRQSEIAVRTSLGASRSRIIGQLFAEGLVLSAVASLVGLGVSRLAFGLIFSKIAGGGGSLAFWMRPQISPGLVVYLVILTVLAAFIIGVVPARSVSRHGLQTALAQLRSGATPRLGRAWTALIVTQVGVAVAVLPGVVMLSAVYGYYSLRHPGFPLEQYLTAFVEFDRPVIPSTPRQRLARLEQQLEREPGIAAVTFSSSMPGLEDLSRFELDELAADTVRRRWHYLRHATVAPGFVEQYGMETRAGRGFSSGDFEPGAAAVLVNEEFVRDILGGRNAVGRRIRHYREEIEVGEAGAPWLEIVGVVSNFPPNRLNPEASESRLYEPMRGERYGLVMLSARTTVPPASLAAHVQRVSLAIDPKLRVSRLIPMNVVYREGERGLARLASLMMGLITFSVLALTAAGMYSLMSFTVTRRRKEIGIRSALGADPWQLLAGVFSRVLKQLGAGCVVGLVLTWGLDRWSGGELLAGHGYLVIPAVMVLMILAGLLAALGPARRGLRVHPAEALKSE